MHENNEFSYIFACYRGLGLMHVFGTRKSGRNMGHFFQISLRQLYGVANRKRLGNTDVTSLSRPCRPMEYGHVAG